MDNEKNKDKDNTPVSNIEREELLIQPIEYQESDNQEEIDIIKRENEKRKIEIERWLQKKRQNPIDVDKFFWCLLIELIPILGLVASIIISLKKDVNINIKNLSKALIMWHSIMLLALIIIVGFCILFQQQLALSNILENVLVDILNGLRETSKVI